jgi:hypothetical protein
MPHSLPDIPKPTGVEVALAKNTYQWHQAISAACLGLCCATMRTMAAAKVGRFACYDKSCVALQGLDLSTQQICIDLSVMNAAFDRQRRATGIALVAINCGRLLSASNCHNWQQLAEQRSAA